MFQKTFLKYQILFPHSEGALNKLTLKKPFKNAKNKHAFELALIYISKLSFKNPFKKFCVLFYERFFERRFSFKLPFKNSKKYMIITRALKQAYFQITFQKHQNIFCERFFEL